MKLTDIKNKERRGKPNPVAKHLEINRPATHVDRKKKLKTPRKIKHKKMIHEFVGVLFENDKTWTKDEIREKLMTDDRWLIRALMAVYKLQTDDEQLSGISVHYNSVGFNGTDANFLSNMAEWYKRTGKLSSKQLTFVRKTMGKYAGQLAKLANGTLVRSNPSA